MIDERNVKIAEACGWKHRLATQDFPVVRDGMRLPNSFEKDVEAFWKEDVKGVYGDVPDYFNDLNAIHEAVLTLSDEVFIDKDGFKMTERVLFMQALERIVMRDTKVSECNFEFYNATAQQRAEAFECVKGLQ